MHTNLPEVVPACQVSLRGRGLPQVCALVRNDIHKPGGQAHRRAKESLDKAPAPVVQWRQLNITKNGKSKAGIVHREPGHWLEARRREAPQVRPGVKGAAPLAASRP